ncbi:MAG: GGDEF domain-containing protein [Pseudobutyrivibrio sp.]|nr:GGDEF domain-containing protein [Pseudobutyrivibrio sp.]
MEELFGKTSPQVVELIYEVKRSRSKDPEKYFDLACDLFDMAQERGNEDLKDYASCTLGDACCINNDFSQAVYYLSIGINGLALTDEYELLARSYNELGIIFQNEGHYITSEEYYMNAIDVARAHRLYEVEAISCGNFASLCQEMDALDQALEYNYRVIECCSFFEEGDYKNEILVEAYSHIVKLYSLIGDIGAMDASFHTMISLVDSDPDKLDGFGVSIARLIFYTGAGDTAKMEEMKAACLNLFYNCDNYIAYFDEVKNLMEYIADSKDYPELETMFKYVDKTIEEDEYINLKLFCEKLKIYMYQETGDKDKLLKSAYNYSQLELKKNMDAKKSFVNTLHLRTELLQQKTRNLFLSAAAETDPLTGIANRLKLNSVIEELFNMANDQGRNLAVEMMDIDNFKHVNDTYGHGRGDDLLVEVGKLLKSFVSDKVFVSRYGGDEFMIFYYDMTDEDIVEIVKKIDQGIAEIGDKLNVPKLTTSQGIVSHVPRHMNRTWDYMNAADLALYFVKNNGKKNARLVHRASELDTEPYERIIDGRE